MDLTLLPRSLDAGGLARHPLIRSTRAGQTRGRKIRLLWHDGPERPLAKHGLALCEESGVWRLERHAPEGDETWPPGLDHRLVETASGPKALTRLPSGTTPEDLAPLAAFEGRRTVFPLIVGGAPVTLTLMHGALRMGEDIWPAARLRLEGPEAAVCAQALVLGQGLDMSVSTRGLVAEALARTGGPVPAPDWRGAPGPMTRGLSVTEAFAHVLGHLTGVLLLLAPLWRIPPADRNRCIRCASPRAGRVRR